MNLEFSLLSNPGPGTFTALTTTQKRAASPEPDYHEAFASHTSRPEKRTLFSRQIRHPKTMNQITICSSAIKLI